MPVSGTHSIVGASVGFALVAKGTTGIHWKQLGMICKQSFNHVCTANSVVVVSPFTRSFIEDCIRK